MIDEVSELCVWLNSDYDDERNILCLHGNCEMAHMGYLPFSPDSIQGRYSVSAKLPVKARFSVVQEHFRVNFVEPE
jgi:hypothetical protein